MSAKKQDINTFVQLLFSCFSLLLVLFFSFQSSQTLHESRPVSPPHEIRG